MLKAPCDEAVILARPADAPCAAPAGVWVLAATILGSSMAFVDGTVVNIAAPVLQQDLGASASEVQWVVQAYSLVLAALILVGGSLGDRIGRRRLFTGGVVLFTVASVGCGAAPALGLLIAARAAQGIGAAMLIPQSLAIISASFEGEQRGRAIGTWSGFTALTAAAGPVVGGLLIAAGSWRYAFFLNVPIAVLALACATRVPESRSEEEPPPLDWLGAVLATLSLGALVYGFTTASTAGFGRLDVAAALGGGCLLLALFVQVERRGRAPMVPHQLFRSRTFVGANLFTLFLYAPLGGALFFLPFDLIQVQGYAPSAAGAALLPFILLLFSLSRWSGGLVARYGAKLPLVVGPMVAAAGFGLFAIPEVNSNYWTTFFPAVMVLGLGMAISVAPLTTTVMNSAGPSYASLASGLNNAVSRTASVLALAFLGVLAVAVFGASLDGRLASLQLAPEARQAMVEQHGRLAAAEAPADLDPSTRAEVQLAVARSFVASFRVIMLAGAALALGASACAFVTVETELLPPPWRGRVGERGLRT